MLSLVQMLEERVGAALGAGALVRRSDHADYQADGALPVARARDVAARDVATSLRAALDGDDLVAAAEVAGPGFLNLRVAPRAVWSQVAARCADPRLGVGTPLAGTRVVVDYSNPNIAKEMHVGHLRSTVIGDALCRGLRHLGAEVVRQNHTGDWGTPFGMLIAYLDEHPEAAYHDGSGEASVSRLSALYKAARARFDTDPEFVAKAHGCLVALQAGDPAATATWREIVAESHRYFTEVYELLGVELTERDAIGESFYNDALAGIAADLETLGVARVSDGALCVFFDGVTGRDGTPTPLIVRKSDGGYGYAVTDLAAVRHRVEHFKADRIWYVVDARQALHFRMVLDTARRAGWLPVEVETRHVSFGTVLGPDGRPFRSRDGDTVRLIGLLTEAVERAAAVVRDKSPDLGPDEVAPRARDVGIGAVKYADLAVSRTRDYVFDLDRMVSLSGNTSVYLQYAHARTRSILRASGADAADASGAEFDVDPALPIEDAERRLALRLDEFEEVLISAVEAAEPHRLCAHLYEVAQALTGFWDACPVLKAPAPAVRSNRLALCDLTARTLATGLDLLGIAAPDRL
ncbi:MAG TPA: arginine--tRNA ligase [Micromonosporaceae bacterium]|nr:arginine--tRNA ligase [Micromonosporaceae bacterium]